MKKSTHRNRPPRLSRLSPRINVAEAAEIIGCSSGRVRQLLSSGELSGRKFTERFWEVDRKSAEKIRDNPAKTGRPRGK